MSHDPDAQSRTRNARNAGLTPIEASTDAPTAASGGALSVADFDYDLPPELVAQYPPERRGASRLLSMQVGRLQAGMAKPPASAPSEPLVTLGDHAFAELPGFLRPGDVMVFNDTRVIKARLFGTKASGGKVELMVERVLSEHEFLAQIRASHAPAPGATLRVADSFDATVLARPGELYHLRADSADSVTDLLDRHGQLPLPPYITRDVQGGDAERYQTVYARAPGAVAAPTAGLHFDDAMLDTLRARGVNLVWLTLHVGAGTFQPVRVENISEHRMHAERFSIPEATRIMIAQARAEGRRVIAVGTTSLRALEAAANEDGSVRAGEGETALFITPGYRFRVVDALLTNFHLPRSTLLMLVSAFAGVEPIRLAYRHAVEHRYRFFSYGDAMLIERPAR